MNTLERRGAGRRFSGCPKELVTFCFPSFPNLITGLVGTVSPNTVTVCLPVWLVSLAREELSLVSGEGEAMKYPASTGTV